jgi:Zn-dependent protease with chaperone function
MKFFSVFVSAMITALQVVSLVAEVSTHHGIYYQELKALKTVPVTKLMFDEDAHQGLATIQRDIITYKNLTGFQRFVRDAFLALDVVMVTPETMPLLYTYVDNICKKAAIATPSVFITRQDGFFNAFAQKLLMSTGGIVIGQKLMQELSDDGLEAVIAHEIGHIKYNHANKLLSLWVMEKAIQVALCVAIAKHISMNKVKQVPMLTQDGQEVIQQVIAPDFLKIYGLISLTGNFTSLISAIIVNKRFEKEADQFACEANGKAKGIIEFFELILKKDQLREEEFATIYQLLEQNKTDLVPFDYYSLIARYYLARAGQSCVNAYKTIYHETFIGAHPSPQARIAAAKEYLAKQQN